MVCTKDIESIRQLLYTCLVCFEIKVKSDCFNSLLPPQPMMDTIVSNICKMQTYFTHQKLHNHEQVDRRSLHPRLLTRLALISWTQT